MCTVFFVFLSLFLVSTNTDKCSSAAVIKKRQKESLRLPFHRYKPLYIYGVAD